jgi:glutamate-1-semialdehyde 2,1-aminomutase
VEPDLTCLGKIIGGGLPVGAYGGRDDIMNMVAPLGPVYQAGTLSGNPLAMSAGIATIKELRNRRRIYDRLERVSAQLEQGISNAAESEGATIKLNRVGSIFTDRAVVDYPSARSSNTEQFSIFFHSMLESGMYLPPSAFETIFISAAHTDSDISRTIEAARLAFNRIQMKLEGVPPR